MNKKRRKTFDEKLRLNTERQNQNGSKSIIENSKLKHGDDYTDKIIRDNERFKDKFNEAHSKRYFSETEDKGGDYSNRRYKLAEEKVQSQEEVKTFSENYDYNPTEQEKINIKESYEDLNISSKETDSKYSTTNIKQKTDSQTQNRESVFISSDSQKDDDKFKNEQIKKDQLKRQAEAFRKEEEYKNKANEATELYDPLSKDNDNDGIPDRYDNNFKDSDYYESTYDVEEPKNEEAYQQVNDSSIYKKEQNRKIGKDFRKQPSDSKKKNFDKKKYDPLEMDTDNDGIADRYDNNFKDSDYFESTFDVEDPNLESKEKKKAKVKKEQNRKIGEDFRKNQTNKEIYQEGNKKKNFSDNNFTRTKGKEDKSKSSKNGDKKKNKSKDLSKAKKEKVYASGMLVGAKKSQDVAKSYLSSGSEDNVGVEGAEKTLGASSKLIHHKQKSINKRRDKEKYLLYENDYELREKKSKLEFRDDVKDTNKSKEYGRKQSYRQFQKNKQKKNAVQSRTHTRFRDRVKRNLKEITFSAKNFIARKSKALLIILASVVIIGTFFINFGGSSLSVLMNTTNSTLTTTYLSSQNVLSGIDQSFSSKEQELRNEIEKVETNYPGYDEYIINNGEYIGHNVHELLSYITSRFGEVKNVSEVESYLEELFNSMYQVDYSEEVEIRYRTVTETYVDEYGNEYEESHEEPYEYKKLIVTVNKRSMDSIIREIFTGYPDNLEHYEALFQAQGNMREAFGNSNLIAWNGGVGGGQEYEASGEVQKRIVDAAYITPSPGPGWCAMWVSQVYQNAGLGYLGGNANDMYRNFTYTSDPSKLEVGMVVAVESSSSGGELGLIYGHVGIYIGDGKVMDNIGVVRVTTLDDWINTFCKHSPVGFGFPPSVAGY